MNNAAQQPSLSPTLFSEHLILIAFVCSLAIHAGFAAFKLDWSSTPKEKPKPIIVDLVKKPAPVVKPPEPVKPKPIVKPKKKVKPKPKPKKKVVKKPKPIIKKVVKPAAVPTPSPVVVPEPVYEPLPKVAPTTEPDITPLPEPIVEPDPTPVVEATPPPPPQPTGPSAAEIDAAKGQYKRQLLAAMNRHKKYPRIAKSRGWQGKVIIQFNLDRNGNILSKTVIQSSGHSALDNAALKMAEKAAPFPRPPSVLQGDSFNIKVPVPFKLKPQ